MSIPNHFTSIASVCYQIDTRKDKEVCLGTIGIMAVRKKNN